MDGRPMYTGSMSKSEATQRFESLEDFAGWDLDSYLRDITGEREAVLESVTESRRRRSVSGDGYWCPSHSPCFKGCADRRWGKYGAAGILFVHRATQRFFLTQRSGSIHFGGTWSVPGGALDLGETAEEGARREASEEMGIGSEGRVVAEYVDAAGEGWAYTTVVVEVDEMFSGFRFDWETVGAGWFTIQEMATLKLHPGFRASFWTVVRRWVGA